MFDHEKIIYLAGIIDGEGSLSVEKSNRKVPIYTARITIVNTNIELLDWVCKNFGGKLFAKNQSRSLGKQPCHTWYAFGTKLEEILKAIQPFSIVKRKQIENILEFRKSVGKTGSHVSQEIRDLRDKHYKISRQLNSFHKIPSAMSP